MAQRRFTPASSLKSFRRKNRLTQAKAAALVPTSQATWHRVERGEVIPRPTLAKALMRLTGVSLDALMLRLLMVAVLMVAGCADDEPRTVPITPTPVPTPTPRANFLPVGTSSWTNCIPAPTSTCTFAATLRNVGTGCATRLDGTVRFFTASGVQVGTSYRFALPPQQIIKANEDVPYSVPFVPIATAQTAADYSVVPAWIDTPCQ